MSGPADTLYVDAEQLAAAFARLQVGHSLIYAHGAWLDPRNATVLLVQGWKDAGRVTLHNARRDEAGRLRQALIKRNPAAQPGAVPARGQDQAEGLRVKLAAAGFDGAVLRDAAALIGLIGAAARGGRLCPSYAEVAEALDLRGKEGGRQRAAYLFRRLNRAGIIEMWTQNRGPKVVSLVGTALCTRNPYQPHGAVARPAGQDQIRQVFS